jgi:hypothetical protein
MSSRVRARYGRGMWRGLALLCVVACAGTAVAQLRFPQTRTALVRFEGTWGPPRQEHTAAADLLLERGKAHDRMQVEEARVITGDRSGPDVLAEAQARRPSFRLRGPVDLLARLDGAQPGEHVQMTGYLRSGSADLTLSSVVVGTKPD